MPWNTVQWHKVSLDRDMSQPSLPLFPKSVIFPPRRRKLETWYTVEQAAAIL